MADHVQVDILHGHLVSRIIKIPLEVAVIKGGIAQETSEMRSFNRRNHQCKDRMLIMRRDQQPQLFQPQSLI